MSKLLTIENLKVSFSTEGRKALAVDCISLQLNRGETLAIVGESGSGKSVTSLSIMRLLDGKTSHIEGSIQFQPQEASFNLLKLPEKEIRKLRGKEMAMIFQEPMTSLNPVITCGEQVAESLRLHLNMGRSSAKKETIELFKRVRLPRPESIYASYPHQISGGQKQRVMIASAISCKPSLLIADEPTTALDVTVQKGILDLLKELQAEFGMSMIFITHDLGIVGELADRVAVMYKGKLVEEGLVKDIFSAPQHPYTRGLLACRPDPSVRLQSLPTVSDYMKENEDGSFVFLSSGTTQITNKELEDASLRKLRLKELYSLPPL